MNSTRLIIVVILFLSIVFFAGCGIKTPPVFTGKGSVNVIHQCHEENDLSC